MARFKVVSVFLLSVLAAMIFWSVLLRAFAAAHPHWRISQGLSAAGLV